jgi:hypothetical protein
LDQKSAAKIDNPADWRVDFKDSWLIISRFITNDKHEASQLTRIKVQQQQIISLSNDLSYLANKHIWQKPEATPEQILM